MSAIEEVRALVDRAGEIANRDVVRELGVSPATAHRLLRALTVASVLEAHGKGRAARYRFPRIRRRLRLRALEEDQVWLDLSTAIGRVRPVTESEETSLRYSATEVINNALEHSRGKWLELTADFAVGGATRVTVRDDGIGVYRRIGEDFGIVSPHEAIVRLEKGKLTSDPSRHSGEGLFFSSKAVSRFRLESQATAWIVDNLVGDSGIGPGETNRGTLVVLEVLRGRTPRLAEVFRTYTDPKTSRFAKTRATVKLAAHGKSLVSRSEAKRLVDGLERFRHVTLDFSGVDVVGQGFCDEVFRVFARAHPKVALSPAGMSEAVAFMVARARRA